jgi:phospholipid/cholesterol/gamma-HCH transport system substrate-binding protein
VTIIGLTFLYVGINFLKGINLFRPINHYFVACPNVKDVTVATPVYVEGFKVGLVRSIAYDYQATSEIIVEINLEKSMKINKGSFITIESNFLSGAELHIHLNKYVDEYLKPGSTIEGKKQGDLMGTVQAELLPAFIDLLPKLDSILYGINELINNPALSNSLENLNHTTTNLEISSQKLNRLLGVFEEDVPGIASNLKSTTNNLAGLSEELKGLNLKQSVESINSTLDNLQVTTAKLNSNDNSLGLLMNDTLLYNNLNRTVENASELLIDLKMNPKRYVRFSLF